jgi:NAD(P)-dependent dehydrogenase (short-subunit alcohol dehydrogenase family)
MQSTTGKARSILITGASTGIGHHAARTLTKRGWHVIAAARKPADVERLKAEGQTAIRLDYADTNSITSAVAQTLELTGGGLDALFNNGAYGQTGALEDVSTQALRDQFEANFFGWHELTRQILPVMRAQKHARIVQCSSVLGFIAMPFRGPYTASKHALEGYTDTLRMEVAPFGIKVVSIQPGPVTSRFRANALAVFQRTIDLERSAYADIYTTQLARLSSSARDRFELGPEAVSQALIKALDSVNPRPIYRVTTPTKIIATAKRLLPTRSLHAFLTRAAER